MRRFRFRLDKILSLREHEERECEIALGRATGRCLTLRNHIKARENEARNTFLERGNAFQDIAFQVYTAAYIRRLHEEVETLTSRLETAEKQREEARIAYVEASSRRKALTKLKEKRESAYYREQARIEGRILDEIGTNAVYRGDRVHG